MTESTKVKCPRCLGTRKVLYECGENCYSQDCPDCAGTGKVEYTDYVKITGRD
jgi:DnaJ-class molecular chaperone